MEGREGAVKEEHAMDALTMNEREQVKQSAKILEERHRELQESLRKYNVRAQQAFDHMVKPALDALNNEIMRSYALLHDLADRAETHWLAQPKTWQNYEFGSRYLRWAESLASVRDEMQQVRIASPTYELTPSAFKLHQVLAKVEPTPAAQQFIPITIAA